MNLSRVTLTVLGLLILTDQQAGYLLADKDEPKKAKTNYTIGKETTFITAPLDKDGYIDYAAALNKVLGKGITPRSNANVLLWKALGPRPEGGRTMPAEFFSLLGIESPPERGDYFVGLGPYARNHLKLSAGAEIDAVYDRQSEASQRPWTPKQYPYIASWLKLNEKPLALVVEATRRPDYFNPLTPRKTGEVSRGLLNVPLPGVQQGRELAQALAARGLLHASEGRTDEAWQDLLACHRLGRLIGRGGLLIEGLIGVGIGDIANSASVAFLDRVPLTSKQARACLRDLQQLPPLPPPADRIDLTERYMFLEIVVMVERHGLNYLDQLSGQLETRKPDPLEKQIVARIDWGPILRKGNQSCDRIVAILRLKDRAAREKQMTAFIREWDNSMKPRSDLKSRVRLFLGVDRPEMAVGDGIGNMLIGMMAGSFGKVQQAADRAEQTQRNLQVAFALAAFNGDKGSYPKELAELAPKYLAQVPNDLFSGKALFYHPERKGYLLYSVGLNGKDDGGRWRDDDPPGDDLRIRIPLPELKRKE